METATEKDNNNIEQEREQAMADTLDLINGAEGWATFAVATNENGDTTGGVRFFVDLDQLTDVMVAVSKVQPVFGQTLLNAAKHVANHNLIDSRNKASDN